MKTALTIGIAAGSGLLAGVLLMGFWKSEEVVTGAVASDSHQPVETTPAARANAVFPTSGAHVVGSPATELAHEDSEAEQAQRRTETTRKNEARWTSESSKPAQAVELEQELLAAAVSDGVLDAHYQPEDISVECRATMCRIESLFAKGADGGQWSTRMLMSANGKIGSAVIVPDRLSSGEYKQVIYAYRLGQPPPR